MEKAQQGGFWSTAAPDTSQSGYDESGYDKWGYNNMGYDASGNTY